MRASRSMKWFAIPKIALSDRQCVPYLGEKQPIRLKTYRPICVGCCGAGIRVGAEANRSPAKGLRRSLEFSPRLFRRRSSRSKVVSWIPRDSGRTHRGNHRCIRCTTPRLQERIDLPAVTFAGTLGSPDTSKCSRWTKAGLIEFPLLALTAASRDLPPVQPHFQKNSASPLTQIKSEILPSRSRKA